MSASAEKASTLRRLLEVIGPSRLYIVGGVACMVVLAATTAAYAWLTGPLLHYLTSGSAEGLGALATWIQRLLGVDVAELDRGRALLFVPFVLVGIGLFKGLAYFGHFYLMGMVAQHAVIRLRRRFFDRLLQLSPQEIGRQRTGDLLSRFGADIQAVETSLHIAFPTYIRDSLQVAVLLVLCFFLDWRLSLIAFGAVPLAVLPLARMAKRLKKVAGQGQKSVGDLTGLAHDTIAGIRVVQAYGMEDHLEGRFAGESRNWLRLQRRALRARGVASPAMELLTVIGVAGVLAFAVRAMSSGALLSEQLLSFLAAFALLLQPAKNLGKVGGFFLQGLASAERIFGVIDLEPSVAEVAEPKELEGLVDRIRFEKVEMRYGDRQVIDGIDLELRRSEVVALVGPSGGGKTTLAALLARLIDPSGGRITWDGVDLRELSLRSLREQIALVPQEVLLFDDTVRANVAYAVEASEEAIHAALEAARALDFVMELPQGLDTRVGEGGASLSGGQRQRLAIARALLRDAPLLILDEATSALDSESEREVQAALETLMKGRTSLVIAHRLSTIRDADRICVLEDGRLVEEGSHEALLEAGGAYHRLYEAQGLEARGVA